jgi:hypothetical protein
MGMVKAKKTPKAVPESEKEDGLKPEPPKKEPPKTVIKSPINWKRLSYFGGGIALLLGDCVTGYFYSKDTTNVLIGLVFFIVLAGAIFLLRQGFHSERYVPVVVSEKKNATSKQPANALNIYPHEIAFEHINEPLGQPHLCRNDKRHYYVHRMATETPESFVLPDFQYFDPENFGQRVLTQPCHQRLFKRKVKMGQLVSLGILALVVGIEFVVMIAMM